MILRSLFLAVVLAAAVLLSRNGIQKANAISADFVVYTTFPACMTPNTPGMTFTSIKTAVDAATTQGTTIYVCPGLYPEQEILMDTGNVTLTGPGATPEDDGVAIVKKKGTLPDTEYIFRITTDSVKLRGLYIDGTPPAGWPGEAIVPVVVSAKDVANYAEISDNVLVHAFKDYSIRVGGLGALVLRNRITDTDQGAGGIICDECSSGYFSQNQIGPNVGTKGMELPGSGHTVIENTFIGSQLNVVKSDLATVTFNTFDMTGLDRYGMSASGNYLTIADNTFKNIFTTALILGGYATTATVSRNTFQDIGLGIEILPADAGGEVIVTISGSPANANTFQNTITLVNNFSPNDINAEYNDWGVCSLAAIEAKIVHKPDIPARGTVDFDPFVLGPHCATPTPTPSPTQSPTATPGGGLKRGDVNCNGFVQPDDGLELVVYSGSIAVPHGNGCPDIGGMAVIVGGGGPFVWGDEDCDGDVDLDDFVQLFEYLIGLPLANPDCDPNANLGDVVPFP